ncbi:MAG TPA: Gfo/Idh/MocA family oxidoreductase [Caulobacteraceae bacterium]|jgi:predicted dehydrogenase|nr:Gfo/Idh/MocA family oxidoreductase [Caulobacteraceae bacterium]
MAEVLRAGVIGAGVFGGYHAQKYADLPGVVLAGVYDHHAVHAEALAAKVGGRVFASEAELIAAVDVVSIATPAVAHAAPAIAALRAGKAVYVEKPLAADPEDAARIAELAAKYGLVAACGFLERVGLQAMGLFDAPERPTLLEAVRVNAPSPRNLDVSVVLDVMIHDVDLALALAPGDPALVEADGAAVANATLDRVDAEVEFDDGFVARFRASRIADGPERTLRVVYPSGEVRVDFMTHAVANTTPFALDPHFADAPAAKDKLRASLAAFTAAVRGERAAPLATARDGARALDLALAVEGALVQQGLVRG